MWDPLEEIADLDGMALEMRNRREPKKIDFISNGLARIWAYFGYGGCMHRDSSTAKLRGFSDTLEQKQYKLLLKKVPQSGGESHVHGLLRGCLVG